MKRKILLPIDDAIKNGEIERINRETRRLEEEAAHAERLREANAARDAAQQRLTASQEELRRVVGAWRPYDPPTTNARWRVIGATIPPHDELIEPNEPKQEEPKVELQKVDTAKFVFLWENSSSVVEFLHAAADSGWMDTHDLPYIDALDIAGWQKAAEIIRTVEDIPLRELPDKRSTVKRGRIQNFS